MITMFSIYYDVLDIKIEGQILSSRLFRKRMLEATQRNDDDWKDATKLT